MALASAAVLILAALVVPAASSQVPAAPPPIAHPNWPPTCGNVSVPYPFGFTPGCYWPGLNLTCDTTHNPPRLLLGRLEVVDISVGGGAMRVNYHRGSVVNMSTNGNISSDGSWSSFPFDGSFTEYGYALSDENELVLTGCNLVATLLGDVGETGTQIISSCSTFCTSVRRSHGSDVVVLRCCHSPLVVGSTPERVQVRWLYAGNHTVEEEEAVDVFVAEEGWVQDNVPGPRGIPLILQWGVTQGLPLPLQVKDRECPGNTSAMLCKSDRGSCVYETAPSRGYWCTCQDGFQGNPYVAGGCQDIDECKNPTENTECFGVCSNTIGSYDCRCPKGQRGDPRLPNGCIKNSTGSGQIIGISVGSGTGSILLVLIATFMTQRFKHMRALKLKQKYFKQNRGQLLQQLVSQRADIAERMIIPVDELEKATNNFDKARELGGGGHGTVYKGILSDLHVVAIKKSKITVQTEIDEFINEVAILSQINHRNVVKLFGCCLETEVPLLVYEFIPNGTLYHHLHAEGLRSLSWETRLRIATETSSALAYLHSSVSTPVIHRDIKSSNILLDDTLTTKVSDFGASRYIPMDKTGLTTRVQGTIGYLDPMYFYTGRLTEKSDVYSFGVILVELLTRKKPFSYVSSDGEGLVAQFVHLLDEENLVQILDPQVIEEGGKEVQEVAVLAASCIKLRGDGRPTMREVEHTLEGLQSFKKYAKGNTAAVEFEENDVTVMNCPPWKEGRSKEESSRRYSLEEEILMSARYPR
ncbi:hypothetical protein ACP70R_020731 [Stipagrostis hirtigluma subsp. patula]